MSPQLPDFETSRLFLKPITLEFVADYEKHFVDYEVISHLAAVVPWPYPEGGVLDYFQNVVLPAQGKDRWAWGIFLKEKPDELIGCVDLWRKGSPENRGFWLGKNFWGRGIMTEAVRPVMDYAFNDLGFERLVFSNAFGNSRSRRVKEKTGARLIGMRAAKFVNPSFTQAETWELSKEEWESFTNSPL